MLIYSLSKLRFSSFGDLKSSTLMIDDKSLVSLVCTKPLSIERKSLFAEDLFVDAFGIFCRLSKNIIYLNIAIYSYDDIK
jgi:hypothetical protein